MLSFSANAVLIGHKKLASPQDDDCRESTRADVYTHRSAGAVAACMLLSKRECIIIRLCFGFKSQLPFGSSSIGRAKHQRRFESCSVLKTDRPVAGHYIVDVAVRKQAASLKRAKQQRPALTTKELSGQEIEKSPLVNSGKAGEPPAG